MSGTLSTRVLPLNLQLRKTLGAQRRCPGVAGTLAVATGTFPVAVSFLWLFYGERKACLRRERFYLKDRPRTGKVQGGPSLYIPGPWWHVGDLCRPERLPVGPARPDAQWRALPGMAHVRRVVDRRPTAVPRDSSPVLRDKHVLC